MTPARLGSAAALLGAVLSGCALDFSEEKTTSPDDIPQLVMVDFIQTTVQDGREVYTVRGKRAENYNSRQEIRLKEFSFQEYDSSGQVASQGRADAATVQTATNDAAVTGTLVASSAKEGVTLTVGGGVDWKNKEKLMSTRDGSAVTVKKDDGSTITAAGMVLNLKTNDLILEKAVTGLWKTETKANDPLASVAVPAAGAPASP